LLALQVIQLTGFFQETANKSENYKHFLLTWLFISAGTLKVNGIGGFPLTAWRINPAIHRV